jgi:type II secretory pathway component PulF
VAAGEKSGHLDTIFEHMAVFWTKELEMRRAIMRPLYYPIAVLHLAILIGAVVEATLGSWVPAAVHAVEALAYLYAVGFILYTLVRISWSSPLMQNFWLAVPLIGPALKSAYAYRWITSLRVEFGAGISIYKAVGDAWRASGFPGCERFAEEGEQAMLQGTQLSQLVIQWKQLPRDWIDFIETGEISGKLDEAFTNLETEANRAWTARQRMVEELLPKIIYFIALLFAAAAVINVGEKVIVDPMTEVDKALNGK